MWGNPPPFSPYTAGGDLSVTSEIYYCRRKEVMESVRKIPEKLCASAFHPSKTRKTRKQRGRRSRPLLVRVFRLLERWNALTHSFSRGFRTRPINYCSRQYKQITKIDFSSPTSNRYHSTSFVKTNAPGGLPSPGTAVLTNFLKKTPNKNKLRH